jgi:hypothetical protein
MILTRLELIMNGFLARKSLRCVNVDEVIYVENDFIEKESMLKADVVVTVLKLVNKTLNEEKEAIRII